MLPLISMQDADFTKAISNAWASRGFYIRSFPNELFIGEPFADFEQLNRLNSHLPNPMEEGYSTLRDRLDALMEIHNLINTNLAFCLTSSDNYLRKFAELILNEQKTKE